MVLVLAESSSSWPALEVVVVVLVKEGKIVVMWNKGNVVSVAGDGCEERKNGLTSRSGGGRNGRDRERWRRERMWRTDLSL